MDKTKDALEPVAEDEILPPTVPVANNVALKMPAFWPDATEVWFAQADPQFAIKAVTVSKDQFLPHSSSSPSGSCSPDPRPDPSSSSSNSL